MIQDSQSLTGRGEAPMTMRPSKVTSRANTPRCRLHRNTEVPTDRVPGEPSHGAMVDTWIKRSVDGRSSFEIADLFGAALEGLWNRAVATLGSVTLTALTERALGTATGRYPFLSVIRPHPNGGGYCRRQLHGRLASVPGSQLLEGLRFALIELLTVIGRLTAEILSHELHAAVMEVTEVTAPASDARQCETAHSPIAKARGRERDRRTQDFWIGPGGARVEAAEVAR